MRILFFLSVLISVLASCSNNNEIENLKYELIAKDAALTDANSKLLEYSNSIVIPYDSIDYYVNPMAFSPFFEKDKKGESTIILYLNKLPSDIKVDFEIDRKSNKVKDISRFNINQDLKRNIEVQFNETGEFEIKGSYRFTFPNGKTKKFDWEHGIL